MRIIHCADVHFDTPFSGLSDTGKAEIRKNDVRAAFGRICALVKDRAADALLIAGDLFDSASVSGRTLAYIQSELAAVDVPVFVCGGNHDPVSPDSYFALLDWPENVHIFGPRIERVDLPELGACVYGRSFAEQYEVSSLLTGFRVDDPAKCNVMVLHGQLVGNGQTSEYGPIYADDIAASGLAYLALGHTHQYGGLQRAGSTAYAYSGCPEGRGFDELGARGALVVDIGPDGVEAEFVPLCSREYHHVTADVSDAVSYGDIMEALRAAAGTICAEDIYKFTLTGETDYPIDPAVVLDGLSCFGARVDDRTMPRIDLDALADDGSLRGMFVSRLRARGDDPAAALALRYGLAAFAGEKVEP